MQRVAVNNFLLNETITPIVDVRSPREFSEGHIEGAINIPLFSDDERAKVGTAYKKISKSEAIVLGMEFVGPKMSLLAKSAKKTATEGKLKVYCWRGGMRSEKMSWLFELTGLDVTVLEGGYKAYRQQLLQDFQQLHPLVVLQGKTGSGKTEILHHLKMAGEQILDLEKRARHKGSAFGALGMGQQPTTAQFQNQLYHDLLALDTSKRIWVESESLTIGKVYLSEALWESMNQAQVLELNVDRKIRAGRIVAEYGKFDAKSLALSIEKIKNRFGGNRVKEALELLKENRLEEVILLLLEYYDKAYSFSKNKYKKKAVDSLEATSGDALENAQKLIAIADKWKL